MASILKLILSSIAGVEFQFIQRDTELIADLDIGALKLSMVYEDIKEQFNVDLSNETVSPVNVSELMTLIKNQVKVS